MFENLTQRLSQNLKKIINKGRLTENNIKETIREVRKSLLEADVTLSVIRKFIDNLKKKSIGLEINKSLTPGQEFIKIVKNELIHVMGRENSTLNFSTQPLTIILFVGLQGVGKTTSLAKLADWIKKKYKKNILIVSTDIYRAAAIDQLKILAHTIQIDFLSLKTCMNPLKIINIAIQHAKKNLYDTLLIDTAGRSHINKTMMDEIHQIQDLSKPDETLLVVDSMMGQDSINMAKIFNQNLLISGIILTKTDSDARSGIALSMRYITGIPIKFIGTGEKITELEIFNSKKIATRILGMHDVVSVIQEIEEKVDASQIKKLTTKLKQGHNFDLNDFLIQIKQIKKISGLSYFINKFLHQNMLSQNMSLLNTDKKTLAKTEAIIHSMTYKEKTQPMIIKSSRKRRIATGSGTTIQDVNKLLKNFDNMQRIMKKIKSGGISKIINNIKNMFPKKF